jgi:hypothetical protein
MNILCDFHHSDLWWSHYLIFEVALGHTLYRPRGMEWSDRGFHQQKYPQVAGQFLVSSMFTLEAMRQYPKARMPIPAVRPPGLRASMNHIEGCTSYPLINTLSFDEFLDAKIDVIMATCSDIQEPWVRLHKEFKPTAKLVREEGNVQGWSSLHPAFPNVLTSDLPTYHTIKVPNKLIYHQRFDIKNIFTYTDPTVFNRVTCFMPQFRACADLVAFAENHDLGGMEFVDYGNFAKRGFLSTKGLFAEQMRATSFVWHHKPGGDGFGHIIHNSFAMGRPVITVEADYRNSIVWPLMEDRKTCILIGRDPVANSKKIKSLSDPATIQAMSRRAADRFLTVVDYEKEARQVQRFLDRLV